jgi:hypothetical protein
MSDIPDEEPAVATDEPDDVPEPDRTGEVEVPTARYATVTTGGHDAPAAFGTWAEPDDDAGEWGPDGAQDGDYVDGPDYAGDGTDAGPGDLEDEEWLNSGPPAGIRLRIPTLVLVALAVAAGAFWGGAVAEKHNGTSTAAASRASAFAGLRSGRGGLGGFGATATPAAEGSVTEVTKTILYLTNSAGNLVKVAITPTTPITRISDGTAGPIALGDTASVQGSVGAGGTVTATSITITAKGATAPTTFGGGFGGGFGGATAG